MTHASDSTTQPTPHLTVPDAVNRWADYAKISGLYPSTSARVAEAFAAFAQAIATSGNGGRLAITMSQEHLAVGSTHYEIGPDTKAEWIRERMRAGALDGVVFRPGVTSEAMHAFSARLVELHRRKGAVEDTASRWPDPYPGIELVHREFDGGFHGSDEADEALVAGQGADDELAGAMGQNSEVLVSRLQVEGLVSASVTRISEQLAAVVIPGEADQRASPRLAKKLLKYVVQCIPDEDRESYGETVSMTNAILGCLEEALQSDGLSTSSLEDRSEVDLRALVYAASRRLFARAMPSPNAAPLEEREERGHAGDDEVSEDLSSLLLELNGLPIVHTWQLDHSAIDHRGEQVRMLLRFALDTEDVEEGTNLRAAARKILSKCTEQDYDALRDVVTEFAGPEVDEAQRVGALRFFSDTRQARLLRHIGVLSSAAVIESFPRDFGLYIDSIDLTRVEDRAELGSVLDAITPERVLGSIPTLTKGPDSLLIQGRGQRLLNLAVPSALPFVEVILALDDRASRDMVVSYLRAIGGDSAAVALLQVMEISSSAPVAYLRDAARCLQYGGIFPTVLTHQVDVLKRQLATPALPLRARLNAVRALGRIGGLEANVALRDLLRKRWGIFSVERREIRDAAQHALERMAERSEGS